MDNLLAGAFGKYLIAAIIVIVGLLLLKIISKLIIRALKKTSIDPVLHIFIKNTINTILIIVLVFAVLDKIGFDIKSLVALLGVSGAAVVLALKDSLSNVAGGIIIIFTKPFNMDDYVEINGTSGTVKHIDLLITTLRTFDNKIITIPNGLVSTSILVNYSRATTRRVDCVFGIGYNDNIELAKKTMLEVMHSNEFVLSFPEPLIGVKENADSCILLDFKVWTKTENYWNVKYYLEENVKLAFDQVGISIPYPQMDVHVKK